MNPGQHILIFAVRLYRWVLSPAKIFVFGPGSCCRLSPSCSQYALEAVAVHGALAGSWLAVKRVCRCHPWGECGHDPVPMKSDRQAKSECRMTKSERSAMPEIRIRFPLDHCGRGKFACFSDFGFEQRPPVDNH